MSLAERIRKYLYARDQSTVVVSALKLRTHALAHLTEETVREIGACGFAELREEPWPVRGDQEQETFS